MARLTESQRESFEALRRTYLAELPARIGAIREAASAAQRGGASPEELEELRQHAHRLVGSSALFGLPRLSAAARALEDGVSRSIEGDAGAIELDRLAAGVEAAWKQIATSRPGRPRR